MEADRLDEIATTLDDIANTLDEIRDAPGSANPAVIDRIRQSIEKASEAIDRMENRQRRGN
jgi:hypothetical protein